MATYKKRPARKEAGSTAEQIAQAVALAVGEALDPIKQKLDEALGSQCGVKVDDETLDITGMDSSEALTEILDEAATIAADGLEESGNPVAAAVIDEGLDAEEVLDALVKSRKSRKAAGEELEPVTPEEAAEVIAEVAEEIAEGLTPQEAAQLAGSAKEADPPDEPKKQHVSRTHSQKSMTLGASRKQAAIPALHRKYAEIFTGARKDTGAQQKKLPPEVRFARAVKCADYYARSGAGGGFADPERAAWAAERYYKDAALAREFKAAGRAMTITDPTSAGLLVPQDYVDDIIPMLYNKTVLFELGAQKVPMPRGNLTLPRQTSGARAHFGGEGRSIEASSTPTFDVLHLSSKRLQALVPMGEELMRSTDFSADQIFGNDLIMQMRLGIEWGGLLGSGSEFQPLGLLNNRKVERVDLLKINDVELADAQGRPTADLPIFLRAQVLRKNVLGTSFGWVMNSDAEQYFMRMKSKDGKFIWKDEMDKGTLNGNPYRTTNNLPTDPKTGMTTLVFGNWSDFILGEQFGLETRTTYDATVTTDTGRINAFQDVMTVTRATSYIDMGNRHNESFIKATNVKVIG